jgi:hypothetical protein
MYFFATPVIQSTDHIKKFRGPRVARASRRSKPEARLNAVQRRTTPYNAVTGNKD